MNKCNSSRACFFFEGFSKNFFEIFLVNFFEMNLNHDDFFAPSDRNWMINFFEMNKDGSIGSFDYLDRNQINNDSFDSFYWN